MAQQKSAVQSGSAPRAGQGGRSVGELAAARSFVTRDLDLVAQFYDSSQEWRRLFSELLGTFLLVLVAAGGGVVNAVSHGQISRTAAVVAPGLMVLAMILFMGAVGGAHLHPVVSLGFAMRRDFPWGRVPGYIAAQLLGATAACLLLRGMFGNVGQLGATVPGPGISMWQATLIEALLTFGLLSTILGTASGAQNVGTLSAIAVGAYIALAGLWASPISGASMNPARSFGPALVGGTWTDFWAYVLGPAIGAVVAAGVAWLLRGSGGDVAARRAAQGASAT